MSDNWQKVAHLQEKQIQSLQADNKALREIALQVADGNFNQAAIIEKARKLVKK